MNDLRGTVIYYSSLADRILETMSIASETTITGEFIEEMKDTPIFKEYLQFFKTGDAALLRYILTFLQYGKKLDYIDVDFNAVAFRQWQEDESRMLDLSFDPILLRKLRLIVAALLGDFDSSVYYPRHGSGFTAEGVVDPNRKCEIATVDKKGAYTFRQYAFGYDRGSYLYKKLTGNTARYTMPPSPGAYVEQVAKLTFVPKNLRTARSICQEPVSRMASQQEVMRWLIESMAKGPISKIVHINDQSLNQRLAIDGSLNNLSDTIDLSAASDSVHIDLVKKLFPAEILYYLLGTRTSSVSVPSGETVELKKFAPMGSAVCFPVECVIFAAVVVLAYTEILWDNGSLEFLHNGGWLSKAIRHLLSKLSTPTNENPNLIGPLVYGDDIICDYRVTDSVTEILTQCGFNVNEAKSFYGMSPFRESCGVFAYRGEDVTPVLFRIKGYANRVNPKSYASWIESINRHGDFGYRRVQSFLIHELKDKYVERGKATRKGRQLKFRGRLPFVGSHDEFGIFSKQARNAKKVQHNADYQRSDQLTVQIRGRAPYKPDELDIWYHMGISFRSRLHDGSQEPIGSPSRYRNSTTALALRWTLAPEQ